MASTVLSTKPHAVCLPFPIHPEPHQRHAQTRQAPPPPRPLHLCITFVNTEFNHRRLLDARGPSFLSDLPAGFQFAVKPDGLPPSQVNATQDPVSLCESARLRMGDPFCALVGDLNERAGPGSGFPPVSFVLEDGIMTLTAHPAGEKFGIPVVSLYTLWQPMT